MKFKTGTAGSASVVICQGSIDERIGDELADFFATVKATEIVFDLSQVGRVNSIGIAAWTAALEQHAKQRTFRFRAVSPVYLGYLLLIPQVGNLGECESFFIPYYCEACQATSTRLATPHELRAGVPPALTCGKCRNVMLEEIDVDHLRTVLVR